MSVEDRVIALIDEGNPIPDPNDLDRDRLDAAAYLATLEPRSSEVTQLDTEQREPTSPKRSMMPWLIAAALAAVVGVAIIVSNQNSGEVPVVDEPTPTTVVDAAPTTAAEPTPVEIGESYINAADEWDSEAALALLAPGAVMTSGLAESPTDIPALFDFYRANDWRWMVSECQQTNVGEPVVVKCTLTHQNAWMRALGVDPRPGGSYEFVITDGEIEEVSPGFIPFAEWDRFIGWLRTNHGTDLLVLVPDSCCTPSLTPEAIVLWEQYTKEFVAEQDGS